MFLTTIPLLTSIIWLPIAVGCTMLIFNNNKNESTAKLLSLITSFISLYLCYLLYFNFDKKIWSMQLVEDQEWIASIGIYYTLGIDGISLPLIILTCLMTFIVIIFSSVTIKEKINQYFAYFLIMQGLVCGVFSALDAILFYVFLKQC